MALPVLNAAPKYDVLVPSMNKKVKFRPYLVKEEKILLLAMESKDPQQILLAISDTVLACIHDELDAKKLTTFDLEVLFLKIRSKSVGERAPLLFACGECTHQNEVVLDIDSIEVDVKTKPNTKIQLTDEIALKMKWPTYQEMASDGQMLEEHNQTEMAFGMITKCIEAIQTEENFLIKDTPKEEVMAFLESLTSDQYKMITEYIDSIPQLRHKVEYDCEKCGHHNLHELRGINDFF